MPLFKSSPEKKALKKVIVSKDTIPSETYVTNVLRLMDDEMHKRVLIHTMIHALEKGLDEKKYLRMLCLIYRMMDIDTQSFLLNQLSIKDDMILNTLPKNASKNTKIFAKHTQLKINLYKNYEILLSIENDSNQFAEDENKNDILNTLDLLLEIAKNISDFDVGFTNMQFHMTDILILEYTVTFYKINCYAATIANDMLKLSNDEILRFIESIKNIDRIRHKFFSILQNKTIKEKFINLPKLSFMPTSPLQTFLTKRVEAKKINEFTGKIDREIETFNRTFQNDIESNDEQIKNFVSRPLISIEDCEEARESLSRSISRSVSRSSSSLDPTFDGESSSFGKGGSSFGGNRKNMANTPKGDIAVAKPVAKRANASRQNELARPSTSFVLMDDSEDDDL